MDFEPYFKVHNLGNVHLKSIKLGQMANLSMIFYVMVSDYRLVDIWNSPQFPAEFQNALLIAWLTNWLRDRDWLADKDQREGWKDEWTIQMDKEMDGPTKVSTDKMGKGSYACWLV